LKFLVMEWNVWKLIRFGYDLVMIYRPDQVLGVSQDHQVTEQELIANIEYACAQMGDCNRIKLDRFCFFPDTTLNHASVVMNLYYASTRRSDSSCNFNNPGVIKFTDTSKHFNSLEYNVVILYFFLCCIFQVPIV
jgi:hypothetical protein